MSSFDETVDKKLRKEDIKNTQFMLLIKYRDEYNKTGKKGNLGEFRKLYKKIKDSLTPDEDKELVESLSGEMLEIYYEDISEPNRVEHEPVIVSDDNEEIKQRLRNLRVLRHIKTLGKASKKSKKSRKKKRIKSRKKKSKKRRRRKTSKK